MITKNDDTSVENHIPSCKCELRVEDMFFSMDEGLERSAASHALYTDLSNWDVVS